MSEPFLSEIRMVGFNFAPRGWAFCDGQILPIAQNQVLFALLGTLYGGDGRTSFALPDMRGRMPLHNGNGINQGTQVAGFAAESITAVKSIEVARQLATTNTTASALSSDTPYIGINFTIALQGLFPNRN
ncbi:MAG: tail fiber protein [Oleispira antarctica]|nr:tail fiber protein [Oleispira antarctica]MBQ0793654.1 tail fiber protein [Oleispira antarctica]